MRFPLLLTFLIYAYPAHATDRTYEWKFHFRNYSIDQGMPSAETYDLVTDDRGFLYISTDRGVVRYDGKQFEPVHFATRRKDYTIFEFTEDRQGTIWCSSYDHGLFYLEDDQLHPYRYNDTLNKFRRGRILEDFCIGKDGEVYFYTRSFGGAVGKIDTRGRFCYITAYG